NLDPCDFLLKEGAGAFRDLAQRAPDPLLYLLDRASARFDLNSGEGSRRAAAWVLGILNSVPETHRLGLEVKQAKVLDTLSHRLRVPLETLNRLRRQLRRPASGPRPAGAAGTGTAFAPVPAAAAAAGQAAPPALIQPSELDRTDLELIQIVLN